jgi:S-layer family protein
MKHRLFAMLVLVIMLIASSGSALAQGTIPPADNPEARPKSVFMSPRTGNTTRDAIPLERRAAHILATSTLVNGNFEQGPNVGWTEYSNHGWAVITPIADLPQTILPHSGNWVTWLGGDNNEIANISQYITTLPSSASLQLVYWIASGDDCGYDYAYVRINSSTIHQWNLCSSNNTNGWAVLNLDLSAYGGQAANISLEITTDVGYNSNLFIDDIFLYDTFADVPYDYWAENFVQRLYNAGITGGCGNSMYCPETSVTRDQMAVFLERSIHGSSYAPPASGGGTGFNDVPVSYWAGAWIKQLAAEGITGGCGSGVYCPESPVTRAQMAVFLLRSKYGASYSPPDAAGSTGFSDVPATYWAGAWIKQLVVEGITAGCGTGIYCPESPVTRAQMAVFLVRTFNLP